MEQVGMRPHVGAIEGNEDRHIANNPDAPPIGIATQIVPLREENPLTILLRLDGVRKFVARLRQRIRIARSERGGPFRPGTHAILLFKRHEQRNIVEPGSLRLTELHKGCTIGGRERPKTLEGPVEQRRLPGNNDAEINPFIGTDRTVCQIINHQMPGGEQTVGTDQHGVAGKGG